MHAARGMRGALGALVTVFVFAACAGEDGTRAGTRSTLPPSASSFSVVPPRYAGEIRHRFTAPGQRSGAVSSGIAPRACKAIYVSDYTTGDLNVYRDAPGYGAFNFSPLRSTALYGWGVLASAGKIYAGTYADTVEVFDPCGSKVVRRLGPPARTVGFPYGMTIQGGRLYATEWPANVVDVYDLRSGSSFQTNDPRMGLPYFLAADNSGHVWVSGWDPTFTRGQVDRCGPAMGLTCVRAGPTTLFPGGLAFDRDQNLTVDDQYAGLCTYRRGAYGLNAGGTCYRSGGAFTALAFDPDGKHLWAANVANCDIDVCGAAVGTLYRRWIPGVFGGGPRTPKSKGAIPLGIAVYASGT